MPGHEVVDDPFEAMKTWRYFPGFDASPAGVAEGRRGSEIPPPHVLKDTSLLDAVAGRSGFLSLSSARKLILFRSCLDDVSAGSPERWTRDSLRLIQLLGFFFEILIVTAPISLSMDAHPYCLCKECPGSAPVSVFSIVFYA